MGARASKSRTTVTTMRLPPDLLAKVSKKAEKKGLSRTQYVEQLIRRDLGMETVLDAPIFG